MVSRNAGRRAVVIFLVYPERPGRPVPVPMHARELKRGTLVALLRQAGVTVEELRELLRALCSYGTGCSALLVETLLKRGKRLSAPPAP